MKDPLHGMAANFPAPQPTHNAVPVIAAEVAIKDLRIEGGGELRFRTFFCRTFSYSQGDKDGCEVQLDFFGGFLDFFLFPCYPETDCQWLYLALKRNLKPK